MTGTTTINAVVIPVMCATVFHFNNVANIALFWGIDILNILFIINIVAYNYVLLFFFVFYLDLQEYIVVTCGTIHTQIT